mmetsp:Transcript_45778/g.148841  ORF Transcript_45778/g.148841 Transcript_45778/m.148841 type:complete len:84 (-) Transcript_45778:399-650(-)
MGLELEISSRGIDVENVSPRAILKLMIFSGQCGVAIGFCGGVRTAAYWFNVPESESRSAVRLSTYVAGGAAAVSLFSLLWSRW